MESNQIDSSSKPIIPTYVKPAEPRYVTMDQIKIAQDFDCGCPPT